MGIWTPIAASLVVVFLATAPLPSAAGIRLPSLVLVHGAFDGGSGGSRGIPLLAGAGLTVVAVQNPLSSMAEDAAASHVVMLSHPAEVADVIIPPAKAMG